MGALAGEGKELLLLGGRGEQATSLAASIESPGEGVPFHTSLWVPYRHGLRPVIRALATSQAFQALPAAGTRQQSGTGGNMALSSHPHPRGLGLVF